MHARREYRTLSARSEVTGAFCPGGRPPGIDPYARRATSRLSHELSGTRHTVLCGAARSTGHEELVTETHEESVVKHPVDVHVGKRVRHRRWMVGMTQQQLAEKVGIKFQQIQKYETGMNRISASRLWDISEALDVPVGFFFEGLGQGAEMAGSDHAPADILADKEALELVRSYYAIPENQRKRLFDLARVLSDAA